MKKPHRLPSSPAPRKTNRNRILVVLGAIGLAAISYECGQSSQDDRIA